jgi:hypothetical protein
MEHSASQSRDDSMLIRDEKNYVDCEFSEINGEPLNPGFFLEIPKMRKNLPAVTDVRVFEVCHTHTHTLSLSLSLSMI